MPHYSDKGVRTNQAKQNVTIVKIKDDKSLLNVYIRHGMIIRDLATGKNWKLKVAEPEQTIVGTLDSLTILTPAS